MNRREVIPDSVSCDRPHCADRIGKILESRWKVVLTNGWKEVNQPLENFCPTHVTPNI